LLLPVIWLVAERNQAHTADSEREWHTQQVSVFAVVLVLVRRCARERSGSPLDDTLSQRELAHSGTLANYSDTHCCTCTCRAVRAPLFLLDDD
jgi:hypothetical protein